MIVIAENQETAEALQRWLPKLVKTRHRGFTFASAQSPSVQDWESLVQNIRKNMPDPNTFKVRSLDLDHIDPPI
jgi:hypothetical protein